MARQKQSGTAGRPAWTRTSHNTIEHANGETYVEKAGMPAKKLEDAWTAADDLESFCHLLQLRAAELSNAANEIDAGEATVRASESLRLKLVDQLRDQFQSIAHLFPTIGKAFSCLLKKSISGTVKRPG